MPRFVHQNVIARTQGIDEGSLPGAGARGRINDDGLFGFENDLHAVNDFAT